MERLIYILDTNVIGDRMKAVQPVSQLLIDKASEGHTIYLCQPVYYEVRRGLLKTKAISKLNFFQTTVLPLLDWLPLQDTDWEQAAEFWAKTKNAGQQLSDTDLLIAALTKRLDAVLVTADNDFDSLPIKRENWRTRP